jgi:hypothetical protein
LLFGLAREKKHKNQNKNKRNWNSKKDPINYSGGDPHWEPRIQRVEISGPGKVDEGIVSVQKMCMQVPGEDLQCKPDVSTHPENEMVLKQLKAVEPDPRSCNMINVHSTDLENNEKAEEFRRKGSRRF